jgi:hypothetical protein
MSTDSDKDVSTGSDATRGFIGSQGTQCTMAIEVMTAVTFAHKPRTLFYSTAVENIGCNC